MIANKTVSQLPVTDLEFEGWMAAIGYFEPSPVIAIATSGGADSMALLLLAKNWGLAKNAKIISLTVNHNLRQESAAEALQVKNWCNRLDIEHHTLDWKHDSLPVSAIQESARNARYKLMANWCGENNILHLLTAHHLGDQAETLFFRLARGSNLEGLSSISAQKLFYGIRLLRPLLKVQKSRLTATLEEVGQKWIEDPSNENSAYARVHIRKQLASTNNEESIIERSSQLSASFSHIRKLMENNLVSQITDYVNLHPEGYATIDIKYFKQLNIETCTKILGILAQTLSGAFYPPRSEKILYLTQLINSGQLNSKYTLAGLVFEMLEKKQVIIIYREKNAIEKPVLIAKNNPILWDRRFLVQWQGNLNNSNKVELRALGSDGFAYIKKNAPYLLNNMPPARIIRTLPSLWILEELLSVPHISYMNKQSNHLSSEAGFSAYAKFCPAKPLAGSGFFVMNNPTTFN